MRLDFSNGISLEFNTQKSTPQSRSNHRHSDPLPVEDPVDGTVSDLVVTNIAMVLYRWPIEIDGLPGFTY
jgi:hypothetical protein